MIRRILLSLCPMVWAMTAAHAAQITWTPAATVEGMPYQSVEELRSFYKLTTGMQPLRKGALATMNLGDTRLELGPGKRDLSIGGLRLELTRPLQRDAAGQLLIAREDWVSWVDPILRPTYIAGRRAVRCVVIDPGHGGHDEGVALGSGGQHEAAVTLQVAQQLQAELTKLGYRAELTRTGDYFVSDRQRVEAANAAQDALFISLHLNTGRSDYRGARVYTLAPPEPGTPPLPAHALSGSHAALAYALQSALVRGAGATDGGCHRAHFSLLSSVTCPAVWVELGYATHEQEGAALATPAYCSALAQALAQGVATFARATDPAASIPTQAAPPKPGSSSKSTAPAQKTASTTATKDTPAQTKSSTTAKDTPAKTRKPAKSEPPPRRKNSADTFRRGARDSRTRSR